MQEGKGESNIVSDNSENEQLGEDSGVIDQIKDPNPPKRTRQESGKKFNKKEPKNTMKKLKRDKN